MSTQKRGLTPINYPNQLLPNGGFDHMSSARKRAAIQKANTEAERLRQKLAFAETMLGVLKSAAEYAATHHDRLMDLCRKLHRAEEAKNQQDWTAVIRALEKVGADSTAAMGSNAEVMGDGPASPARRPAP